MDKDKPLYCACVFCDGDGCCVCDHFGVLHKDHSMYGIELISEGKVNVGEAKE